MIRPVGFRGAAFGAALEGDGRKDPVARAAISAALGIPSDWAWVRQVHGTGVAVATEPGLQGPADGIITSVEMLPLAIATADCYPVVIEGDDGAGIAHVGWRGAVAGVVTAVREALLDSGTAPIRAAIGPGIRSCCFEVGAEVSEEFDEGHRATTRWGTQGIDLVAAIMAQLEGLDVWDSGVCTMCGSGHHSFRRDGTAFRQVGIAWVPKA
ncbi:laccase domain-containing protein [bacterium]|nr:laccase domain-containing protein [bacterium]